MDNKTEKNAVLVTIAERTSEVEECERSLDELERLLNTAGGNAFARVIQVKDSFDPRTCIGSGKVREIAEICANNDIDLVVFDFELSPAQIRNLENELGDVTVIDRSMLILDIFALHAVSGEGKLQVELAQLKYTAPRLVGKGLQLSRQGGGIGSRGPGESKLETDRRHLHERIVALESRLRELENNRAVMRAARDRSGIVKLALVGYTNAGKSTLLNRITDAGVLAEDKLFATLDSTTRKYQLPNGENVLFTDTVGFIRKLPHHLVKAFKSTLDEVVYADILLIIADANDPEVEEHLDVTEKVVSELGVENKLVIYVYNKCDIADGNVITRGDLSVKVSGATGDGVDDLLSMIEQVISRTKKECDLHIPYFDQSSLSMLYANSVVLDVQYLDEYISVKAILDGKESGRYSKYIVE